MAKTDAMASDMDAREFAERMRAVQQWWGGEARIVAAGGVPLGTFKSWKARGSRPAAPALKALSSATGLTLDYLSSGIVGNARDMSCEIVRRNIQGDDQSLGFTEPADATDPAGGEHPGFVRLSPVHPDRSKHGGAEIVRHVPSPFAVSVSWLDSEFGLSPEDVRWAQLTDDGMSPGLVAGAAVIVDARVGTPLRSGSVQLVTIDTDCVARRLFRRPDLSIELVADAWADWRYTLTIEELDQLPQLLPILWSGQRVGGGGAVR